MHIVLTNDARRIAGGENFVLSLALGLQQHGHEVTIAAMLGGDLAVEARARRFETIDIAYHSDLRMIGSVGALTRALRDRGVDVIHTNSNHDRSIGAFAARRLHCRCIASVHSCLSIQHNLLHRYRNHRLIQHFTPDGYSTKAILVEKDGIPAERITVVHNALPDAIIETSQALRAAVRNEFGIPNDAILIGNVGRLVEFKGHTHLLDAMARLHAPRPRTGQARDREVYCMIVGDGELERPLKDQARALGIEKRVLFPGYRNDLSALFSTFDIFSLPSIDFGGETYPLVVLTALWAGLPIVASDVGDVKYMVRDGINGFLLEPGNAQRHAEAIQSFVDDDALRVSMGNASIEKARAEHSFDAMISEFEQIYRMVLDREGARP